MMRHTSTILMRHTYSSYYFMKVRSAGRIQHI